MAEPTTGFDLAEWVRTLIPSILAGIGSALAMLRGAKRALDDRMSRIERQQAVHTTEIAVIAADHRNSLTRLDDIQETSKDTNRRIEEMQKVLTQVLLQVRKP